MNDYTYCTDCDHLQPDSAKGPPWAWQCQQHPRFESFGFVTNHVWDKFPPFLYCKDVNGGRCPLFEPRKETPE